MPFNKVSVLENVWLHDLQKAYREGKILQAKNKAPSDKKPAAAPTQIMKDTVKTGQANPSKTQAPASKPAPQKTKINKLKLVPTNSYKGGFG